MGFNAITLDIADAVAVLTLNRPDRLNSFNDEMHNEIRTALARIQQADSGVRCLVITGAGRGFCAGADLGGQAIAPAGQPADLSIPLERDYNPMIKTLRALPFPIVTAVNGPAAGAGMSLAMAGDIILAGRSASFLQAFCNIGLVPDAGSTYFLPRLVGRARAAGMALLGEKLPAETAAAWGLVWQCVDDDKLMDTAMAIARKLAAGPTKGLGLIRQALQDSWDNDLAQQLDLERDLQRQAGRTADFAEGVAAFMQKRPAKFQGH